MGTGKGRELMREKKNHCHHLVVASERSTEDHMIHWRKKKVHTWGRTILKQME